MSHNIQSRDKQYGLEMAWHQLTKVVDAIKKQFFFTVRVEKLQTPNGIETPFSIAVANDDGLPCGVPFNPETYSIHQPTDLWELMEEGLSGSQYTVESIGSIGNRNKFFITCKMDELNGFQVGSRTFKNRLSFFGNLDKSAPTRVLFTNICTVCENTFNATLREGEKVVSVRHTKNAEERLRLASQVINSAAGMEKIYKLAFEQAEATPCSAKDARFAYLGFRAPESAEKDGKISTRLSNEVEELSNLFANGRGNSGKTRLDWFSGLTERESRRESFKDSKQAQRFIASATDGQRNAIKATGFDIMQDNDRFAEIVDRGKILSKIAN